MNKLLIAAGAFVIINLIFLSIPPLVPRMPNEVILPYQLWCNVIILFLIILPQSVGNFDILYKN